MKVFTLSCLPCMVAEVWCNCRISILQQQFISKYEYKKCSLLCFTFSIHIVTQINKFSTYCGSFYEFMCTYESRMKYNSMSKQYILHQNIITILMKICIQCAKLCLLFHASTWNRVNVEKSKLTTKPQNAFICKLTMEICITIIFAHFPYRPLLHVLSKPKLLQCAIRASKSTTACSVCCVLGHYLFTQFKNRFIHFNFVDN